jgi:hypothetical protein
MGFIGGVLVMERLCGEQKESRFDVSHPTAMKLRMDGHWVGLANSLQQCHEGRAQRQ